MIEYSGDLLRENFFYNKKWHLCYYIPKNKADFLSSQILNFKNGDESSIIGWTAWSIIELYNLNIQFDYVVRCLGSTEVTPILNKPLDYLGKAIEDRLKFRYYPTLIKKTGLTQKLSSLSTRKQREKEIYSKYSVMNFNENLSNKKVLVVDDVLTSGSTTNDLARAIKLEYSTCELYLFTLAKKNREENKNKNISNMYF